MTNDASNSEHLIGAVHQRDVVTIEGPDATAFLQGQLSQDVDALAVDTSTWTFVLQPQGKVDVWGRLTKTSADSYHLDVDAGTGETAAERLRRFLIRTKADITLETLSVAVVRGEGAPRDHLPDGVRRLPTVGPGVGGYDLLGAGAALPSSIDESPDAIEVFRIRHGVPSARELDAGVIPAELGNWIVQESVSFTKGCYVGQELTARIDSRGGNVPRHLRLVAFDGPVASGAELSAGDATGTVTSATSVPEGTLALALCGRRVEVGATVVAGDATGTVHELPDR